MRDTWRVYFPDYSIGSRRITLEIREWIRANVSGQGYVKKSHVRFTKETDALMFWLAFR